MRREAAVVAALLVSTVIGTAAVVAQPGNESQKHVVGNTAARIHQLANSDPQRFELVTTTTLPPTTTTTAPKPKPKPPSQPATMSTGPFAIPTYIVMCESGGNYTSENGGDRGGYSTASGAYQILDSTWAGFGGYSHAADAPPAVQDEKARQLWNGGAGKNHWKACL